MTQQAIWIDGEERGDLTTSLTGIGQTRCLTPPR